MNRLYPRFRRPASDPLAGLWRAWCGRVVGYAPGEAALPDAEIQVAPPEGVALDIGGQWPTKVVAVHGKIVAVHGKIVEVHGKIVESLAPMARRCLIERPVP